jgi:hypothetical protein
MNEQLSQGDFNVRRRLDGALVFSCPARFVVAPNVAVEIVKAILHELGGEIIFAGPRETVIRPPATFRAVPMDHPKRNGNGYT